MKVKDDPKLKKLKEILSGSLKSLKKTEDTAVESNLSPEDTKTPQLTSAAAFESPLRRIFFEINRSGMRRTLLFWSDIVALYI